MPDAEGSEGPSNALPPGLYDDLITVALAQLIDGLGQSSRVQRLDLTPDAAPRRLAEHVGQVVPMVLQSLGDEGRVETGVSLVHDLLAVLGIVVVGEKPYAEGQGDDQHLGLSSGDTNAIDRVCSAMPCVVVLICSRPMLIADLLPKPDAFVAAWLPGTEGQGVADVLFGDSDFTGTLPITWPRDMTQIPINVGDATYDPLFPYGHGLTYGPLAGERDHDEAVIGSSTTLNASATSASSSVEWAIRLLLHRRLRSAA